MLAFVDESGDSGMKLTQGSTPYFVVAMVVFQNSTAAAKVNQAIESYRKKLRFRPDAEFHFTNLRNDFRAGFFEVVSHFDFKYYATVFDKNKLQRQGFQDKGSVYKYACSLVMSSAKDVLCEATVVIDGSGIGNFDANWHNILRGK